jgi:ABC-type uncharacterized transport system involved in gliding motility auxiliary subunit
MATRDTVGSPALKADWPLFLNWGQERTGAALTLQKELLASYEQVNRAWFARVQSEVGLWSDLATKLTATKTVLEALEAYAKCISDRMKMAADDGRLLSDEAQQITQKITKALGNGWLTRRPAD